jgi:hypothetical protein
MSVFTPVLGAGPHKDRPFPRYAADYFRQVREQYQILIEQRGIAPPPSVASLLERVDQALAAATDDHDRGRRLRQTVTWADVFALETATIYAMDATQLAAALWTVRLRYREVAGQDAYAEYLRGPISDTTKSLEAIRADVLSLCDRMRYLYTFVPTKEAQRNHVARLMLGFMLVLIVAAGLYYSHVWQSRPFALSEPLMMVLLAGSVGGFISIQQRLQQPSTTDPLFKELELAVSGLDTLVAPVLGAIFATVLYLVFVAHLVSSDVFPGFACAPTPTGSQPHDLASFVSCTFPQDASAWAKLAIWAFIAGFAERFVPDVLTRLAATGSTALQRGGTPVPTK